MSALLFSTFPWQALGLLVTILVGGLIFSNQDMLDDSKTTEKAPEEKCSDRFKS